MTPTWMQTVAALAPDWVTDVENVDRPARSRARIAGKVRLAVHDRYAVASLWIS